MNALRWMGRKLLKLAVTVLGIMGATLAMAAGRYCPIWTLILFAILIVGALIWRFRVRLGIGRPTEGAQ